MKKLIVTGLLISGMFIMAGCGDAPKPKLKNTSVEEIRIEEIRVEEIKVEEITWENSSNISRWD